MVGQMMSTAASRSSTASHSLQGPDGAQCYGGKPLSADGLGLDRLLDQAQHFEHRRDAGRDGEPRLCHVLDQLWKSFGAILCQIKPVHGLGEA